VTIQEISTHIIFISPN